MSAPELPLSVLVPTRNCAALLPAHLEAMRAWAPAVREIVVVDSQSSDATLSLIAGGLKHPRLRILQHPPGLYQSWNFGLTQLEAEFGYISTVGETITLAGLRHLVGAAQNLKCDAVISKPRFISETGTALPDPGWPIEDILAVLRPAAPVALAGPALFFFTLLHYRNAILGSSASNLYRSAVLRARPFPTDYGTAGDGGWCLEHCAGVRIGVTPAVFSTFQEHPKAYPRSEYAVDRLSRKMLGRIEKTFAEASWRSAEFGATASRLRVLEILALLRGQLDCQEALERARSSRWPWSLNPKAWRARRERNRLAARLLQYKAEGLRELFPELR